MPGNTAPKGHALLLFTRAYVLGAKNMNTRLLALFCIGGCIFGYWMTSLGSSKPVWGRFATRLSFVGCVTFGTALHLAIARTGEGYMYLPFLLGIAIGCAPPFFITRHK